MSTTGPIRLRLNEDKKSALIEIGTLGGVALSADQVDQIIAGLGKIRGAMTPPVPAKIPGDRSSFRDDIDRYHAGFDAAARKVVLSFRSAGLGWLSFMLGVDELEKVLAHHKDPKNQAETLAVDKSQSH